MTRRHLATYLVTLLIPLALGLLTLGAARAALSPSMTAASNMSDCHDQGGPMPANGGDCRADCPLVCAAVHPDRPALDAPIRPYTRLEYDLALGGLAGRALKPELPPPRRDQA